MSWLWSNSAKKPDSTSTSTTPDAELAATQPVPGNASPSLPQPQKALSAEAQAEKDLESFLASLEASSSSSSSSSSRSVTDSQPSTSSKTSNPPTADTSVPDPSKPLDISPSALYPRTMSCRQAFDSAFYCQSLGGKFNDIYRFGALQSCSEHWSAFWFCMRTKSYAESEKQERIAKHYMEREKRKQQVHGSSEAVWELRTTPVEPGRAFWRDPDTAPLRAPVGGEEGVGRTG